MARAKGGHRRKNDFKFKWTKELIFLLAGLLGAGLGFSSFFSNY